MFDNLSGLNIFILYLVNQVEIVSPQQQAGASQLTPPLSFLQQFNQLRPTTIAPMLLPFAPPLPPIVNPQCLGPAVSTFYSYPMYSSPSTSSVNPTCISPGDQVNPNQNYPLSAPLYTQQEQPPSSMCSSSLQEQEENCPSVSALPEQLNSPGQHTENVDVLNVAPKEFKVGMKVEAVDRQFPYFVCIATIAGTRGKNHEVLIHFDSWSNYYDYWCGSDAIELHPVGWCETYGWKLQYPKGIYV